MLSRAICLTIALTASAAGSSPALADAPNGAELASACTACHGPAGRSRGDIPTLAGVDATRFAQRMQAYREGGGTIMGRIAPAYGDAQIQAMARYFARQTPRHADDESR